MDLYLKSIEKVLKILKNSIIEKAQMLEGFLYKECPYKNGTFLPEIDDSFMFFDINDKWAKNGDSHAWFYKKVCIPECKEFEYIELKIETDLDGWNVYNPQFIVYIDGKAVQGLDTNHRSLSIDKTGDVELFVYAYSGSDAKNLPFKASFDIINRNTEKLYYDILVPFEVLEFADENSKEYADIKRFLLNTINLFDLREPLENLFFVSVKKALDYLNREFYDKYRKEQSCNAFCVGHTHIDIAWLWTLAQTKEKAQHTFSTVLKLMEKYPDFVFFSSQPQLYQYVKEEAPELYERIKQMVKSGRWEVEGAMWVEADCNLTSGESLVRQIIHGKRFFKEEFDFDSKILWLPDVFGYSAALPQICKKSGVDYFLTSKISWNDTNKMPYDTFMWKGIDGSEIFTYFLTAQDKVKDRKSVNYTTYVSTTDPKHLAGAYERYSQKELSDEVLVTYGWGDGGGGPTKKMLEKASRQTKGMPSCPNFKTGKAGDFLKNLYNNVHDKSYFPKWVGELYLEYHRGTYTSVAKNKRNNRKSELLYQNAELLCSMANVLTAFEYPEQKFYSGWQTILLNQFHDILPGSSIPQVYNDSDEQYTQVKENAEDISKKAYKSILDNIKTDGGIVVFNPHSFIGSDVVFIDGQAVFADGIPAKGYKVIKPTISDSRTVISNKKIENDFFTICFDDCMQIISLYDKRAKREVIKEGQRGNVLRVYEDLPFQYDCWNLEIYYKEKSWIADEVVSCEVIYNGARSGFKVVKRFMTSTISQYIWAYDDIDRIDFETEVDWQEKDLLLKTEFVVDINAESAIYDIQFGHTNRPTHSNTSWDEAKFEVCAQKYADLSDFGYGVSLINDCKYGYDIHGNTMKLSLIKCSGYPNNFIDKGHHTFTYSLFPHSDDFRKAGTIKQAMYLNQPMTAFKINAQDGKLKDAYSLISCDKKNVLIETVKKAYDDNSCVFRMYESFNMNTDEEFSFGFIPQKVWLCDLLENNIQEIQIENGKVKLRIKPFEIITIKVEK